MMARSRREGTQVAALFLDLDNFKDINDSFGHQGGDELLKEVASRLVDAVRDGDSVGRIGGDEFVVVADGASMAGDVSTVANRILHALSSPFVIEGSDYAVPVTVSIGMAEGIRSEPEQLLLDADVALYQAKAGGKHQAVLFSPSMQAALEDRRHLERDLHQALSAGEFVVEFVPTLGLSDDAPTGVEARLGWNHPVLGRVDPDQFSPLLESSELIVPVGRWLLEQACRYGAGLAADDPSTVSVAMSAVQFRQEHVVDQVRDILAGSGCDASRLIVVLAELALRRDDGKSMARLRELKALGVRIGIGEFATGYSTFSYLRDFPIDVLQIDRNLANDSSDPVEVAAVIETLGHIGKAFGVAIVAERPAEAAEAAEAAASHPGQVVAGSR
jgi:diguanylate cyclase (GGDEF)-like protein